ncbi:ATP-dependent DNA helicase-like protein [Trifolium pratense]|uniref:ATP-dependent DNA helicase-like protein n=1 Tax=Trifolium pratense TaxID=57577 RepID=A0A2K3N3Z8_TRIPR|nr:ATP-dependent DNA helicase-like protein [Trifolium pratense]
MADRQQSGRISAYFSASKPLLPQKRAYDSSTSSPYQIKGLRDVDGAAGRVRVGKRVPLADVPLNRVYSSGNGGDASFDAIRCSSSARTVVGYGVSAAKENLCQLDFETPRKESGGFKSEPLDYFSGSGLFDDDFDDSILEQIDIICEEKSAGKVAGQEGLDRSCQENVSSEGGVVGDVDLGLGTSVFSQGIENDDFDESILEQIDILCEQKSAEKAAGQGLDNSCQEKVSSESGVVGNVDLSLGTIVVSEVIGNGDMFSSGIALDHKEEHVDSDTTGKSLLSGTMPEEYLKYLESLNERQREAACTDVSTPLMIVAGPGSGKTSTMVGRVLVLLNEGISPLNILAMTFTSAAATEMRKRIGAITGKEMAKELTISTFHSFCLQLCRSHAEN